MVTPGYDKANKQPIVQSPIGSSLRESPLNHTTQTSITQKEKAFKKADDMKVEDLETNTRISNSHGENQATSSSSPMITPGYDKANKQPIVQSPIGSWRESPLNHTTQTPTAQQVTCTSCSCVIC